MSFDLIQSKEGLLSISPKNTLAGFPGSVDLGGNAGTVPLSATDGGGAIFFKKMPRNASTSSIAVGGTATHNNAGCLALDVSGGANATGCTFQVGSYHGQVMWIVNTNASFTIVFSVNAVATIGALKSSCFVWNAVTAKWYQS